VLSTHGSLELRNASLIRDLDAVGSVAPIGQTIGGCPGSGDDWGLINYLQRFYRISLRTDGTPANGWFLVASGMRRSVWLWPGRRHDGVLAPPLP
jgi:hypothetical protein